MKLTPNERRALRMLIDRDPSECRVSASRFYATSVIHPATARQMRRKGWITFREMFSGSLRLMLRMAVLTDEGRKAYENNSM